MVEAMIYPFGLLIMDSHYSNMGGRFPDYLNVTGLRCALRYEWMLVCYACFTALGDHRKTCCRVMLLVYISRQRG